MEAREIGVAVGATVAMLAMVVFGGATVLRRGAPSLGIRSRTALRVLTVMDFLSMLTTVPLAIVLYALFMQQFSRNRQKN
ncbi:putative IMV membrane protein [Parapoxvirus red deer/HL953]|uniref:Putative IMV membrane protein n=1 Tax=Parapoxvirus red deer/HL953 TaxID=1579460 RepID=A0A0A7M9X3_9POXV|nr:putative IMV membrane protein [Parapoxvirus red deer/HL953]AIZ77284.1 putative IMV membrane protein [Parapoxvirus red deer/HL953]